MDRDGKQPDFNAAAAALIAKATGTRIPVASDLTDDEELLAKYEAAKAKEASKRSAATTRSSTRGSKVG